ncbi:MAG TPA: diguanylate cyclase [Burkholderiaceae bacterium]|nr:diguanylate cyclase [Burkholderiaceae bacterium]
MNTIRLPLRTWLLLLAGLSTLPLLLLAMSVLWSYKNDRQRELQQLLKIRTAIMAQAVGERVKTAVGSLQGIAESEAAMTLNVAMLYAHARRVVEHNPDFRAVTLVDDQGMLLFLTSLPLGGPTLSTHEPDLVTEVLRTQSPNVSGPFVSPVNPSDRLVAVTVPIVRDGTATHALRMILTTASISEMIDERRLPPQWVAGIADRNGILVARSRAADRYVGQRVTHEFMRAIETGHHQTFEGITLEGIHTLNFVLPAFGADWFLGVGVPKTVLNAPVTEMLWRIALVAGLWITLSVVTTRVFAGYLTRQMRIVTQVFERDELGLPTGQSLRVQELWDILQRFWQAKQAESAVRKDLSAVALQRDEVQDLYDHAPCGYHSLDHQGRVLRMNQTELGWLGLSREQAVGRPFTDFLTEDSRAIFHERFPQFVRDGSIKDLELELVRGSGTPMPVLVSATAVKDAQGHMLSTRSTVFDNTDQKMMEAQLERLAHTDMLTSLSNRRDFYEHAARAIAHSRRHGAPLSLALMDIDHFKKINDTYGHGSGDQVLRKLSHSLGDALRETDVPARLGGEEFAVLMPTTALAQALAVAERLRDALAHTPVAIGDEEQIHFTVSIGVTAWQPDDADIDATLHRADEALYRAKHGGRNRVEQA